MDGQEEKNKPSIKTIKTPPALETSPIDYGMIAEAYIEATRNGNDIKAEKLFKRQKL